MRSHAVRIASLACLVTAASAQATLVYDYSEPLPGQPSINGTAPFARLTIQNAGANDVHFTLEHFNDPMGIDPARFITALEMNYSPFNDDISVRNATTQMTLEKDEDRITDASFRFDLRFGFAKANQGDRVGQGQVVSWDVQGQGVSEDDFNHPAQSTGGSQSTVFSLLKMQGLGPNGSGSTKLVGHPVPEPASLAALSFALLPALRRRKRR
jgi:hypothetical protein